MRTEHHSASFKGVTSCVESCKSSLQCECGGTVENARRKTSGNLKNILRPLAPSYKLTQNKDTKEKEQRSSKVIVRGEGGGGSSGFLSHQMLM